MYDTMSVAAQFQDEEYDRLFRQETGRASVKAGTPVLKGYGWRYRKTDGKWGVTLRDYHDRDELLCLLQVGQCVKATVVTRGGVRRERLVRVTHLAYGYGKGEAPTRADAEIMNN